MDAPPSVVDLDICPRHHHTHMAHHNAHMSHHHHAHPSVEDLDTSSGATVSCKDIQAFCVCNSIRRFLYTRHIRHASSKGALRAVPTLGSRGIALGSGGRPQPAEAKNVGPFLGHVWACSRALFMWACSRALFRFDVCTSIQTHGVYDIGIACATSAQTDDLYQAFDLAGAIDGIGLDGS